MKPLIYFYLILGFFHSLIAIEPDLDSKLTQFESYIERQRQAWNIPAVAVGIIKEEDVIFEKGFGERGLQDSRPVNEKTLFQIGSLTKGFTSALLAWGVDKKLFHWNDKVIKHIPDFRLADPWVTAEFEIADLCAQRSGLPPYAGDTQAMLGFAPATIVQNLQFFKPISSFRAQYAYQNSFFLVAAHLLEKKTGKTYHTLLQKEIFQPLGMQDASSTLKDYLNADNRVEWLRRLQDGSLSTLPMHVKFNDWNYLLGPAGGINATLQDMTKWVMLQANQGSFKGRQLISTENLQATTRSMIYVADLEKQAMYYAMGWVNMQYSPHPIIWHDGATLGVYNVAAFMPEEKLGIVILTNVRNTHLALALALQFFDLYFNKPDQDWSQKLLAQVPQAPAAPQSPHSPQPSLPLENYAGTYHNEVYGDAVVKKEGQKLSLKLGENDLPFLLEAWDRDIFTLKWPDLEDESTKVFFLFGNTGQIEKMQIESLLPEGQTFQKMLK